MKLKTLPLIDIGILIAIFFLISSGLGTQANLLIAAYLFYMFYKNLPVLLSASGSRSYNAGDREKALQKFKKAVKHPYCKPHIKSSYGYILLREGRMEEAEPWLLEAVDTKTKDPRFHYNAILNLAIFRWKEGRIEEAIDLVLSIKEEHTTSILYEILGYLHISKGDYPEALRVNLEAYEYNPDDNVIVDNLAQSYYFLGRYDEALSVYAPVIDDIRFPEAHYFYGIMQWAKGDLLKAHDALAKTLRLKVSFLSNLTRDMLEAKFEEFNAFLEAEGIDIEALRHRAEYAELLEESPEEDKDAEEDMDAPEAHPHTTALGRQTEYKKD